MGKPKEGSSSVHSLIIAHWLSKRACQIDVVKSLISFKSLHFSGQFITNLQHDLAQNILMDWIQTWHTNSVYPTVSMLQV